MLRRLIFTCMAGVSLLHSQQPQITNAALKQASAAGGLQSAIRAAVDGTAGSLWIGYAVPALPRQNIGCRDGGRNDVQMATTAPLRLEGPSHVVMLIRFEQKTAQKLRMLSPDCALDAGGLPFFWLSDVKPADSIAFLVSLSATLSDAPLHAIALHAGPEATAALIRFTEPSQAERTRKTGMFWLANSRGKQGFDVVEKILRADPSDKIREHAIFALTQSKEAGSIPAIIRAAREDKEPRVRSQALFWLGRKASQQGTATIVESLDRDPDVEVKKKAVFALSQIPDNGGVPQLIRVARTHADPAVRKQAVFWLGRSRDPRAVEFFAQVLSR